LETPGGLNIRAIREIRGLNCFFLSQWFKMSGPE